MSYREESEDSFFEDNSDNTSSKAATLYLDCQELVNIDQVMSYMSLTAYPVGRLQATGVV